MKIKTIIYAILIAIGFLATACSNHTCPAYAQDNDVEQTEKAG